MSADEANVWRLYFAKHGMYENNPRTEIVLANIAHLLSVAHGIKSKVTNEPFGAGHFLPWMAADEEPISLEDAMRTWN